MKNSNATEDSKFRDVLMMLQAAENYVVVSEDLRPKVLETARCNESKKNLRGRSSLIAMVLLIICISAVSGSHYVDLYASHRFVQSGEELKIFAAKAARVQHQSYAWGLADALSTERGMPGWNFGFGKIFVPRY